ncbi:MAG: class I SAM-dependent methyltransferase [Actinobacteria bacterium]|nr:class I SAM-dependent methyltransferase [Acidimicrobiia bacterium]MCA1736558.1 class I SAM-dependent methyltransferase [Actinomycetota bacterium]MDQ3499974.1 class I SAM-dependent methyltransferase [Actinomycetota bacterium]
MSKKSDAIFGRIARRYDLLNTLLSAGRDQSWRRQAVAHLPMGRMLDLGSGTGAAAPIFGSREVVALDPVRQMLGLSSHTLRVAAVGEALPFPDQSFDGVFSAYVFRNLTSVDQTLAEVRRVLRPGGVAAIVDLGRPRHRLARLLHRVGTAITLPLTGLIAFAPTEYWYLHRSLDKLPPPELLLAGSGMRLGPIWRMGIFGFVYGAVLCKD